MRTLTLKRPALAAAPISPETRRAIVLAKVEKLTISAPTTTDFKVLLQLGSDLAQLRRMARSKASLGTVLRFAERVATAYGLDMAAIDPCHGSAA